MEKLKKIRDQIRNLYKTAKSVSHSKWDLLVVALDFLYCKLRFHITTYEYKKFKFYNLKNRYRKHFLLRDYRTKIINIVTRKYTRSKFIFYKRIPDVYKRDIILAPHCGEKNFVEFVKKNEHIIVKPDTGSVGEGVFEYRYSDEASAKKLFSGFSLESPVICETFIKQHRSFEELCPYSLNTVRIVTILYYGEVEVVAATLKMGTGQKGEVTDTMYTAQIDIETRIVSTFGFDKHNSYACHPATGTQIIGLKIPYWNDAIELVKESHKRVPKCLIYGWDIAIKQDGIDVVEAGNTPNSYIMQLDGIPKGRKIIELLKEDVFNQPRDKRIPILLDYVSALKSEPDIYADFLATQSEK